MRRALLLCAWGVIAGCGGPTGPGADPRNPTRTEGKDVLEKLALEIDPGPQSAIWPQIPTDVRTRVEIDAPRDKAPEARLAAGDERLGHWSLQLSITDPALLPTQLYRAFEGVFLVEPLALAPVSAAGDKATLEARALLWRFYNAFNGTAPMLRSFESAWGGTEATKLASALAAADLIANGGVKTADHLAAEILRARAPDYAVSDVLWEYASRKLTRGDAEGGRALYAEYAKRSKGSGAPGDLMRTAQAYIRLEDARAAADAIARATAAIPAGDRIMQARLRAVDRDRATLVRFLALPSDKSPEATLARFDLLLELDRGKEAEALLAALAAERPKDARVRARAVQLRVRSGEITDRLVETLRGDDLTDRDGAYWSIRIGAAGIAVAKSAPTPKALNELVSAGTELAKFDPGRAAALAFVVERTAKMLAGKPDALALVTSIRASFDDAVVLRSKYPATTDADRIVIALALFTPDASKGFQAAVVHPKTAPVDDPELYKQRAQTLVTLAAYIGKSADLDAVRKAAEEIPPSADANFEGARDAILGDVDTLSAVLQGERAAWARAVAHYESAKKSSKLEVARLDNNLAFAAMLAGDTARANTLFEAAGRAKSERTWVPVLNLATAPSTSKDEQLASIRTMSGPPDSDLPPLVNTWRASLEPAVSDAGRAATRALADFDGPLAFHKVALNSLGLEAEGTFALGIGLRSGLLGHTFSASAFATLWLARPMPLTRAELEAKAKAGAADATTTPAKPTKPTKPTK